MPRSRSAQSLKNMDQAGNEDKLTIISQMFWIAVSMLESDYEYEFSLAVRLLDKVRMLVTDLFYDFVSILLVQVAKFKMPSNWKISVI